MQLAKSFTTAIAWNPFNIQKGVLGGCLLYALILCGLDNVLSNKLESNGHSLEYQKTLTLLMTSVYCPKSPKLRMVVAKIALNVN